jgi:transposase
MMSQETSMMIRHYAEEGVPKSTLARQFGVCRQTVYNHLDRGGPYRKPREARSSKLDPYKDYIRTRLDRFDLPATVLNREVSARGYSGSITIVRDFVRSVKRKKAVEFPHIFPRRLAIEEAKLWRGDHGLSMSS